MQTRKKVGPPFKGDCRGALATKQGDNATANRPCAAWCIPLAPRRTRRLSPLKGGCKKQPDCVQEPDRCPRCLLGEEERDQAVDVLKTAATTPTMGLMATLPVARVRLMFITPFYRRTTVVPFCRVPIHIPMDWNPLLVKVLDRQLSSSRTRCCL